MSASRLVSAMVVDTGSALDAALIQKLFGTVATMARSAAAPTATATLAGAAPGGTLAMSGNGASVPTTRLLSTMASSAGTRQSDADVAAFLHMFRGGMAH